MNIAIIPARGGSKRIPRKNIREFAGQPMIAHSIQTALKSNIFDRIIVSTDDDEIAQVALNTGAQVPFKRPAHLSDDFTGTVPVIAHAVAWMTENIAPVTNACCIYATAPFVIPEDLIIGHQLLVDHNADYAFSVTEYAFPIQRALKKKADGKLEMFFPEFYNTRSQDLEEGLHDAGQFYWGSAEAWLSQKPIFSSDSIPVMLPRTRVQDIDTYSDWERAEQLYYLLKR
ncbi:MULTISPECIES: pseudaminic acid cytidylyltransferase [Pantoea]|uniref:pseudaminic acid cytidylyltransferase n=1 Tax=Pantoea TaxID=53335 RepID=UPI0024B82B6D|nr:MULTISPECIES: pseudaminic acid cytidylyltransferase [Pantoea]MDJ0022482.1 pseudaminic acid cytidylyltransferase [Pantoea eucrina]